jgi:hypothetical protein
MLRVGSRVPITTDKGTNYMDVGLNVDVDHVAEVDGKLAGTLSLEMNNLAPPEQGQPGTAPPLVRNLRLRSPFSVTPGKPANVGTIDDVNSKRRFQVEITATRQ